MHLCSWRPRSSPHSCLFLSSPPSGPPNLILPSLFAFYPPLPITFCSSSTPHPHPCAHQHSAFPGPLFSPAPLPYLDPPRLHFHPLSPLSPLAPPHHPIAHPFTCINLFFLVCWYCSCDLVTAAAAGRAGHAMSGEHTFSSFTCKALYMQSP